MCFTLANRMLINSMLNIMVCDMKNMILISFLFIATVSCKKGKDSFTVRVVEYGTQIPIAEARIEVFNMESQQLMGGLNYTLIDEVYTDQNGEAFIDSHEGKAKELRVFTRDTVYFDAHHIWLFEQVIDSDFLSNPTISLYPFAWVKLEVNWSVFQSEFDSIRINDVEGCGMICDYFIKSDTVVGPILVFGNRPENKASITGYINGQLQDFTNDGLYSPAFDTVTHLIYR